MSKKIAIILVAGVLFVSFSFVVVEPSFAAGPAEQASCMGHEAAGISPPGSSDEFPDGAPGLKKVIDTFGVPPGAIYSTIAKLHEGSHEACDEVLE